MSRIPVDERRELLLEAAIRVMARDGVASATTRAIVAEAGMPLAAFHYSFRNKRELLENVIMAIQAHSLDRTLSLLKEQQEGTFEQRVRTAFGTYWQHVVENPDEHRLTYELTQYATRQPALADLARYQYASYVAAVATVIEAVTEASGVRLTVPMAAAARFVLSVIDGLTRLWLIEQDEAAVREALGLLTGFLTGLTKG